MESSVRTAFVDFDHDATTNAEALMNFRYVSKGGFALVFLADYQRRDGVVQPVAVKVLKPENHFKPSNYQKFLQEVAFHTAMAHGSIVRTLGFCSVQASKLLGAAPADLLVPGCGGKGRKAKSPLEWFAERRLTKCWALVMEMMPDGNLFDQVHAAATAAAATAAAAAATPAPTKAFYKTLLLKPVAPPSRPPAAGDGAVAAGRVGSYSNAQALLWMIDVADAMTFLHSQQPLLVHRDLKLENILLRREADGCVHAKLADFGLMVAVDASGKKLPPPKILRAPGQSLQDVLASAPTPPPPRGAQSNSQLPLEALKAPLRGANQSQSQKQMQQQQQPDTLRPGPEPVAGECQPRPQRSSFSWTGQGQCLSGAFKGGSGNIANATGSRTPAAAAPPSSSFSQAQVQLQPDSASSGSSSSCRRGRSAAAEGKALEASSNLQEAQAASSATAGASVGGGGAAGGVGPSREPGMAAAALPGGVMDDLQRMPSLSRLSATSHAQVKLGQLNGVMRMGMGHKDYLPDMYQMTFKLTGQCGSVCYMAPEVARQLAYNQKADVFSFGCILYEVLTRRLLSESIVDGDVDAAMEYISRVAWSGWRPDLPTSMAKDLRLLISLCWHREPRLRPSFPTIASRLREALSRATEPSVPAALRPPGQPEQPHPQLLTQQPLLQQQASVRRNQAGLDHSPSPQQQPQHQPPPQQQPPQQQLQQPPQQQSQQHQPQQQQPQAFFPAVAWTSGPQAQTAGLSPFRSGPVPSANGGGCGGRLGTTQQHLQLQLQQLQLAQQQQQQQMAHKQKQQQHYQQLQLQLDQLNACTRVSSTNQGSITYNGMGPRNQALLPSPVPGCDTSNGTHSSTTNVGATHAGRRECSPMFWSPQARATSSPSEDVAFPIAGTLSPCDAASLPSPVVGRASNGVDVSRLTGVTGSEPSAAAGSVSVSGVSVLSPRSSQAEVKRLPPSEGCMSLCTVM